jgi:hypothetical protein
MTVDELASLARRLPCRIVAWLVRLFCRPSISSRFILVLAIGFACQAGISGVSLIHLRVSLRQEWTREVKNLQETAYSVVAFYHEQASKGAGCLARVARPRFLGKAARVAAWVIGVAAAG